ncbi:MAG: hypothetical protein N2312_06285 [Dictyoglomaceae bacterium]|nr:hypothetical protein [Dictyoglomaceae bacterium]
MVGRSWKRILEGDRIKNFLINAGGIEEAPKSEYELWRIKLLSSTFIYYKTGTLYSTPSEEIKKIWEKIDSLLGGRFEIPTKNYLMGFDETGKGEIIGPLILVGVLFKRELFKKIDYIINASDTKKSHDFYYWNRIYQELKLLKEFHFEYLEISERELDKFNINVLMDRGYKKLINNLLNKIDPSEVRIVIDDYGIGKSLREFLKNIPSEIIIENNSEEKFLETRCASIIAKAIREEKIKRIREDERYIIEGKDFGSGNLGDEKTREWLRIWHEKKGEFPDFVRKSFLRKWKNKEDKPSKSISQKM